VSVRGDKDQTTLLKKISASSVWCNWDYGHDTFYHIYRENPTSQPNGVASSPNSPSAQPSSSSSSYSSFFSSRSNSGNNSPVFGNNSNNSNSNNNPFEQPAFYLECLQVTPNTVMNVYRYTLPLSSTMQMNNLHALSLIQQQQQQQQQQQASLGQCCLFPHDTYYDFQLVRLRNNVDVLCRQQPHPVKHLTDIIITVYMLHHQQTRKFTIRLDKSSNPRKCRVIFGGINDILYAFIPGVFLKLIDCGIHHKDPRSFITLRKNKDNFITDLPSFANEKLQAKEQQQQQNLHVNNKHSNCSAAADQQALPHNLVSLNVRVKNRAFLLNLNNGEVYECTFSLNHFVKWLEDQPDCENYAQVMHWAITHLQNQQFAEKIIRSLSSKQLSCMGSEVMKEYIVANTYLACKQNPEMHKEFTALLKNSVLDVRL